MSYSLFLLSLFRAMNDMMDDDDFMTEKHKQRLVRDGGLFTFFVYIGA